MYNAAGPTSLEDYFQKGALLGQKSVLNLWYVDTIASQIRKNCSRAFEGLSYLACFLKSLCLVLFFIHIIQFSLFSIEY